MSRPLLSRVQGLRYVLGAVRCGEEKAISGGTAQSELPRRVAYILYIE